jgi:hypothetical protein
MRNLRDLESFAPPKRADKVQVRTPRVYSLVSYVIIRGFLHYYYTYTTVEFSSNM